MRAWWRDAVVVIFTIVLWNLLVFVALNLLPGRFEYVRPAPAYSPTDMEIWVDGVEYFCHMDMMEWKCDETGKVKGDGEKVDEGGR
jgi:hypothetical protein